MRYFAPAPSRSLTSSLRSPAMIWLLGPVVTAVAVVAMIGRPEWSRWLLAVSCALVMLTLALVRPKVAVLVALSYLFFVEMLRRLLIPAAPWVSFDPLLVVGTLVAAACAMRVAFARKPQVFLTRFDRCVAAILLFGVLELANPLAGGVTAALVGTFVTVGPLLWYFSGRFLLRAVDIARLLRVLPIAACCVGAYGLAQSYVGLPWWDQAWLPVGGYVSLNVGQDLRGFGTFASSSEYGAVLAVGAVVAVALGTSRPRYLLSLLVIAPALFLSSERSRLILTVVAILAILAFRYSRGVQSLLLFAAMTASLVGFDVVYGANLQGLSAGSSSLVTHQINGITSPFDAQQSTLSTHASEVVRGFLDGFTHPFGQGPAGTSDAAILTGAQTGAGTEFDTSNAFVAFGLLGGTLFLFMQLGAYGRAVSLARRRRQPEDLAVLGIVIATLGTWLIGGLYFLTPLVWILLGRMQSTDAQLEDRCLSLRGRRQPGLASGGAIRDCGGSAHA
jgi:hypothetical protein